MRTLLLELRPRALSETSISELLHQLGEATVGRARVPVNVDADANGELPVRVKVAFYRIAQEALNNIAKHAGATQVNVTLRYNGDGATLCICDDGVGFDPDHLLPDNLGVRIMRERSSAVGATLSISSHPGEGSTITTRWRTPESRLP
jgi:signal transduction histidine kinase